ncbi:MAG: GNAT family N-acetyltransferase [Desulfurococcales archaeon]|nr:GNAT family N-acetyltransferase [Desulfurococcales archaeon]
MGSIVIRKAREADYEEIAVMIARLKTLNEELDPHFKVVDNLGEEAEKYASRLVNSDKHIVLVAEDTSTSQLVGVIVAELQDRVFYKPRIKALITDLYVKPRYRRRRLGTLLIEKLAEEAARRGAGILSAIYPSNNAIAERFYEEHGFSKLQVERFKKL